MRLRSRDAVVSLTPSSVEASRIRQHAVTDERRGRERDRLRHHRRRRGKDPGDLQEQLGFLKPLWRLLPVELAKVLHGCGQERIPSGTRARGLWFSACCCSSRPSDRKFRGQVVQDRPCKVSVGPPGAYRVGVVAECDPGWLARVSCRVHRSLVRSRRLQPTVRLRRRSTSGEPAPGLRVWGFARSSRHIGEPGRTMSRIMSGKVPSEVRGNRAAVARGGRGTTMSSSTRASPK